MTTTELKTAIHRQVEKYDAALDNSYRNMAFRKLLRLLEENYPVIEKAMPDFQKLYCELQYCYSEKSSINKFVMSKYVSKDMHEFVSEGINEPVSNVMAEALDKSFCDAMSRFLPSVISRLIHHFWDEFDKATK